MKYIREIFQEIFDDKITKAAGLVFVLIVAVVSFNVYSNVPEEYPLIGAFTMLMVPLLFIAGGIIFILAILKS